ncbi:MAG: hypothetical protein KatS3mg078_0756 [Deltaproteobacteria bacterium]|jgi:hypothetical protein|nr:MAG: hypothetical protein KatS3mg078_0756 [Deltaproteobacteria bacterium]
MSVNTEKIIRASRDYLYLKRRGYSIRSVLELVGNHYQLNTNERNTLYRGFFTTKEIRERMKKTVDEKHLKGRILKVDGYNQLITIESYRKGNFVFIATDGLVRDSAAVYRSYKLSPFTEEVLNLVVKELSNLELKAIEFYFDKPISFSGELCKIINALLEEQGIKGRAQTVNSPDYILKTAELVATSDSVIIDKAESVFDLAGWFLRRVWKARLTDFRRMYK